MVAEATAASAQRAAEVDMENAGQLQHEAEAAKHAAEKEAAEAEAAQAKFKKEAAEADKTRLLAKQEMRDEKFVAEQLADVNAKRDAEQRSNVNVLKHAKAKLEKAGARCRVVERGGEFMLVVL